MHEHAQRKTNSKPTDMSEKMQGCFEIYSHTHLFLLTKMIEKNPVSRYKIGRMKMWRGRKVKDGQIWKLVWARKKKKGKVD